MTSDPELGPKTRFDTRGQIGVPRGCTRKKRAGELTEPEARAEGILPVEEEDHSRGYGRRAAHCHLDRAPPCRRGRCGMWVFGRAPRASRVWDDHTGSVRRRR